MLTTIRIILALAATFATAAAHAQTAGVAPSPALDIPRPGDERLRQPEFEQNKETPRFTLPPAPEPPPGALSGAAAVFIRKINVEGATVFTAAELAQITAPYENRLVTAGELHRLRHTLTVHYINNGYVNSGAVIPDQKVTDGVVTLRIIEGLLEKITVLGVHGLDESYVRDRIALGAGPPLNINALRERLQLLQQDPLISRVNAGLAPGVERGRSVLEVAVAEQEPVEAWVRFGNNQSPSAGANRGELTLAHRNITGRGDAFEFRMGRTDSLTDFDVSYTSPLGPAGTELRVYFRQNESWVIEAPFTHLDIGVESETHGLALRRPFYKTVSRELVLEAAVERRRSQTYLLGKPYSFSASADNGATRVSALRLRQSWTGRERDRAVALRSTFSVGLDAWNATIKPDGEDGKFFAWLGQLQWARRFGEEGFQALFRADAQLTGDSLPPLERFAVGGASSVRGYREFQLVRDNGFSASLEFLVLLYSFAGGKGAVHFTPFADYGRSWRSKGGAQDPDYLASVGAGLRLGFAGKVNMQIYYGYPLKKIDQPGNTPQEEGIHFMFSSKLF